MNRLNIFNKITWIISVSVVAGLMSVSCTNKFFVAVLHPTKTKSIVQQNIKVYIDIAPNSLVKNRIMVVNKGSDTMSVYPVDITLRIRQTGVTLPAVMDYRNYVLMRHAEAVRKCAESSYPYTCSDGIDKYFKPYFKVKPFTFGDVAPRAKKAGYFAFNLPDPFNTSAQASQAAKILKTKTRILDGSIFVRVSAKSTNKDLVYEFPVNVITSSDETQRLLAVRKNY